MAETFCHDVLKVIVGQICQNMGWHAVQSTPLEVLTDILHRYLLELPRTAHRYCEQFGRTEPNLDDVGLAFQDLSISLSELHEYIHNVDIVHAPFEVPKFPIPRLNHLNLEPEDDAAEIIEDNTDGEQPSKTVGLFAEFEQNGPHSDTQVVEENGGGTSTLHHLLTTANNQEEAKNNLKRCPDANITPPQLSKRARLMNDEELSNTNVARDLTSVFMTSGGVISPSREGKLPDAKTPQYALPSIPQNATPDLSDQASAETQAVQPFSHDPSDIHSNEEGNIVDDECTQNSKTTNKKSVGNKKPINRAKKAASNAKKNSNDAKTGVKKTQEGNATTIADAVQDNGSNPEKPKKKSASKNSKANKKVSKNPDSKLALTGITPLNAKEALENSENITSESDVKDSENSAQIDDTIDSVIQQSCDSKKKKPSTPEKEESGHDTSLDDTIEDVIQKSMMGSHSFSTATAARVLKSKDVYDFSDSGGEGADSSRKSKTDTAHVTVPSSTLTPIVLTPFRNKKEKTSVESPTKSSTETPTRLPIKVENSSKASKKRGKARLTKAARKEIPMTNLELQKFDREHEEDLLGMRALGIKMEMNKEPTMLKSPFHNPPGFPVLNSFHHNLQPSFTTNLGPPPPAHQGSSSSSSALNSSMLTSPQLYPPFPRSLPNLAQFRDLSFSRPPPFSSGLSSSSFSGMVPTPAHTPQPKFLSSSSNNNNVTSYNISSSAASDHNTAHAIIPSSSSNNDTKLPLDVQVTSSSFSQSQTSPTLVLSVKSEPLTDVSTSPKVEIKSSIFSSAKGGDKEQALETTTLPLKPKNETKTRSKDRKKDKKEKTVKKEKGKRGKDKDKKDKGKDVKEEPIIENDVSSAKATIQLDKRILIEEPPIVPNTSKKEKTKGKDKRKIKSENQQATSSKDEPVQKIKLKIGLGGGSKCYIQPSSPAPVNEKERTPTPPPPPPPVVKATPEPKPTPPATRGRKKGTKATTVKTTPPKKSAAAAAAATATATPPSQKNLRGTSARALITQTIGTTVDEDGNRIWICPTCGRPDDGSAMIGCDSCDDWHHWICVKIVVPPKEEDSWFCARCISKQQEQLTARSKKKKKHKRDR